MKLSHSFYTEETLIIAKNLLGKKLVHETAGCRRSGLIVEVEAYRGTIDKAAHSYRGKPTTRTEVMFGPPSHAYVYLIYGMYHCLNVVTAPEGTPEAILIRAIEPLEGIEEMALNRFGTTELTKQQKRNLTNGPGKLAKALGITREQNGLSFLGDTLYIEDAPPPSNEICTGPRINIDYAEEAVDFPWRFYLKDHPYVSSK